MANPANPGDRVGEAIARLMELTARLRSPEGCPWDRAQDYDSLKGLLLEEAYEVVDAVNVRDFDGLEDELGDLLFQVLFYSRLAEEDGRFALAGVMERLHQKLVRRHPHVFGEVKARTAEEALRSWNSVKRQEREAKPVPSESILEGTAATLPAALEAHELGVRVAEAGFDWPNAVAVLDKVQEEIDELRRELHSADAKPVEEGRRGEAGHAKREEELGDLLFSLSQLARHLGTDPESCLRRGNQKFRRRFQALEQEVARQGRKFADCSLADLEAVWERIKAAENPVSAGATARNSGAAE